MALTRIQLVDHVLNQAQLDSSYRTLARGWLNIVRRKFADNTNYKIWRTTTVMTPFVTGQASYALPSNFLRSDTAYLYNSSGQKGAQIFLYDSYPFDAMSNVTVGDPSAGFIDEKNRTLVFNATPNAGSQFALSYYYAPTDYSTDSTDDAVIPDFPNQNLMIQEMILIAYEARDDERYMMKMQEAEKADVKNQRTLSQNIGTGQIELSQAHYRARRRRF